MKVGKKVVLVWIISILISTLFLSENSVSAYTGIQKLSNEYLEIATGADGRFSIGTTGGNAENILDDYKKLLYGHPSPGTSYTTIRVDGTDYFYTSNNQNPVINDQFKINISEGKFGNIKVKQVLSLIKNNTTQLKDTVEIRYIATNTGEVPSNVGARIMMDTMLGENDHAPFKVPGVGDVTTEKEFTGNEIPSYWQAFDNLSNPSIVAHGSLLDVPIKPDKVQFVNWGRTSSSPWDFYIIPGNPNGDSAVNIYWNEKPLQPGETREYVTYYGISDFVSDQTPPVSLNIAGPSEIDFDGVNYSPNPFTITGYIKNISDTKAKDVKLAVRLPDGISLASGSESQIVGNMEMEEEKMISWNFKIDEPTIERIEIELILTGSNIEDKRVKKTIQINNTSNPVLESIQILPNEINLSKGQKKNISVFGYYSNQTMEDLTSSQTGTRYSISDENVATITEDGELEAKADSSGGVTTITATNGNSSTTARVTVTEDHNDLPNEIIVMPGEVTLEEGQSYQLEVFAYYPDGLVKNITTDSQIRYSSLDNTIAKINNVGCITTTDSIPGTTNIKVEYRGISKEMKVIVNGEPILTSIEVVLEKVKVEQGKSIQLYASSLYSNGSTYDITNDETTAYKSYDTNRASVNAEGTIQVPTSAPLGDVGIKVSYGGKSKVITLTVISGPKPDRIEVAPQLIELERGKGEQLSAILYMNNGESKDVTAEEGTIYKSYDTNRAVIDSRGNLQIPINAPLGDTSIRVTNSGKYQTVTVKVKSGPAPARINVTPDTLELERGKTAQLTANLVMDTGVSFDITKDEGTTYKSYDLNRAVVDSSGLVQVPANAPIGEVGIRVSNSGKYQLVTAKIISSPSVSDLEVTPSNLELKKGESSQIVTTSILTNGERKDVTGDVGTSYKSYDTNRAIVNNQGVIQVPANAPLGEVGIRVTHGGKYKTITVKITSGPSVSSLEVIPETVGIVRGESIQLRTVSLWTNGDRKDVTVGEGAIYKSYSLNRAQVDSDGLVFIPSTAPLGDVGIKVEYGGKNKLITISVQ